MYRWTKLVVKSVRKWVSIMELSLYFIYRYFFKFFKSYYSFNYSKSGLQWIKDVSLVFTHSLYCINNFPSLDGLEVCIVLGILTFSFCPICPIWYLWQDHSQSSNCPLFVWDMVELHQTFSCAMACSGNYHESMHPLLKNRNISFIFSNRNDRS